jgi:hypothetical protein
VLDPHGDLGVGDTHVIPFWMSEADMGLDAFLLTPYPWYIDFELQTPDGTMLTPANAGVDPNIQYVQADHLGYYRIGLPALPADATGTHAGVWNAVLRIGGKRSVGIRDSYYAGASIRGTIPYDLVIHCYSNLAFHAYARQSGLEPGATVWVSATLDEYDVPVDHRAFVWADLTRPDGSGLTVPMPETDPGRFEASFGTSLSGLYTMRVRASGSTFYGAPFQREQTLSAAVYPGGDRVADGGDQSGVRFWCELVDCLESSGVLGGRLREILKEVGVDFDRFLECVRERCRQVSPPGEAITETAGARLGSLSPDRLRRVIEVVARELGTG